MHKLFSWCKENILAAVTLFLLAFIPLYPKLPLINIVQTWVYIRFEDFLILTASAVLLFKYWRQKRLSNSPLQTPIFMYWGVGLLSLVNALLFIFPRFGGVFFPHLAVFHYVRRIEYMILFFLAFEAFRKKQIISLLLWTLGTSYLAVILYGFGQKFLGFPAFMTMNEEFAKGVPLRLPPNARFPSTFAGHYDLAAYLVLTIPVMGSLIFGFKKWWQKTGFFLLTFLGLEMLLFTASRVSFGVYLVVMSVMLVWQKKPWYIIPMIILSIFILNFTSGASERFYKTFRVSDVVVDLSTGKPIGTLDKIQGQEATLQPIQSPAEETLPKGSEFINLPSKKSGEVTTVAYYKSVDVKGAAGNIATISGSFLIQKALVYDISITTRIQAEWPKAIVAFRRNILLGSGYSTLSLAADGDYHRMLGETGLLGAVSFLGIFAAAFYIFFKYKNSLSSLEQSLLIGLFAGVTGLLLNAVLIDVFEASKVAYVMWIFLGLAIAILLRGKTIAFDYFGLLKRIATHPVAYVMYLMLAIVFVWKKAFGLYFLGDDFTWLRWASESNVKSIVSYFTQSQGFFYRPIPKLWYFSAFSVFWLEPFAYHLTSVVGLLLTSFCIYRILMVRAAGRIFSWCGALLFASLAIHHENVYWISGQSSMLSALFLITAVYLFEESYGIFKRAPKALVMGAVWVLTFLSMMSYDGMVVAPVIVLLIALSREPKNKLTWGGLLFIPLYLFLRTKAGALSPQGDYGYKTSTAILNTVVNTVGYAFATFGGPKVTELFMSGRSSLRGHIKEVTLAASFLGALFFIILAVLRKKLIQYRLVLPWILSFVVSLAAYAPLGGMADRYAYIPSMFLVISVAMVLSILYRQTARLVVGLFCVLIFATAVIWNIREVSRVGSDWVRASITASQALAVIKEETFPPKDVKTFFFINTPIKYGAAWVFPTGLNDAIWHMYRQSPYRVFYMPSLEQAYEFPLHKGDREVFIFENYLLKRGVRLEADIPVKSTSKK